MPHKVGNKWKWGNIKRDSKKELAKVVYGIWKNKHGGIGKFKNFWETGKISESIYDKKLMDYQLNETILKAYKKIYTDL